ncbi:MAG: HAMP domain-containing sensor histidine kinase, partial [Ghiorsea sp.]
MNVLCDGNAIQQMVMNLINNAHDALAGRQNKTIAITLEQFEFAEGMTEGSITLDVGRYACLTIEDNGSGIKKEDMAQIFEPYFTTKPVGEGTGLGLSTLFGTVESHGGKVGVSSEVDKGTVFTIYLPLVEPELQASKLDCKVVKKLATNQQMET